MSALQVFDMDGTLLRGTTAPIELSRRLDRLEPLAGITCWTSDVLPDDDLHFVTLHHRVVVGLGEPRVLEPDKVGEWRWVSWSRIPQPIFKPTASLLATGWQPDSIDVDSMYS